MSGAQPVVVAVTGASGAPYVVGVLRGLVRAERSVSLVVSGHGMRLLATELGIHDIPALRTAVGEGGWDALVRVYDDGDRGAAPASGSARTAGMVICPCSMGTLSAIAVGASRSLVERAADVTLKEGRRLILVPRETPLSAIHLENMLKLARLGVTILPASPGFYHGPRTVQDLVDFIVARVLDHLDVEHDLVPRWTGEGGRTAGPA